MTRTTITPVFTPIYTGGGGGGADATAVLGLGCISITVLGALYAFRRPRFRLELRGPNLYIAQGGQSTFDNRIIHFKTPTGVNICEERTYNTVYGVNNIRIAETNGGVKGFLEECENRGTHTIVEYTKLAWFGFDKKCQKTLHWKDAKRVKSIEEHLA